MPTPRRSKPGPQEVRLEDEGRGEGGHRKDERSRDGAGQAAGAAPLHPGGATRKKVGVCAEPPSSRCKVQAARAVFGEFRRKSSSWCLDGISGFGADGNVGYKGGLLLFGEGILCIKLYVTSCRLSLLPPKLLSEWFKREGLPHKVRRLPVNSDPAKTSLREPIG